MSALHLVLALQLATAPADAPVADEGVLEVHTAVLELPTHEFVTRGAGCWLDSAVCIDRAKERAGYRAFVKSVREDPSPFLPGWAVAIAGVAFVAGLVVGGYLMIKACSAAPSLCR